MPEEKRMENNLHVVYNYTDQESHVSRRNDVEKNGKSSLKTFFRRKSGPLPFFHSIWSPPIKKESTADFLKLLWNLLLFLEPILYYRGFSVQQSIDEWEMWKERISSGGGLANWTGQNTSPTTERRRDLKKKERHEPPKASKKHGSRKEGWGTWGCMYAQWRKEKKERKEERRPLKRSPKGEGLITSSFLREKQEVFGLSKSMKSPVSLSVILLFKNRPN